jgi:UDP-N-acetylmuramate--alanine ligase
MNLEHIKNIHFVGIGGIGMSGIAEILAHGGTSVSGCDLKRSAATDLLISRGISVSIGHDPAHLAGCDAIVVTAAVKDGNEEIEAARRQGVRIIRRSEMLGELVNRKRGIGVSGTHGKTTTSAIIATVLQEAGFDPTVIVGGMLRNFSTNAKTGSGDILVVEADEYDRTFHHLYPEVAVVTNIEADHLEYYGTFEAIQESFRQYLANVREGGLIVACVDDPAVADVAKQVQAKVITYGLGDSADVRAVNLRFDERGSHFDVPSVGSFRLFVPGEHNVRNALAAIVVARHLGVTADRIAAALAKFLGVDRRFQILGDYHGALVVDDYAHHPTEIRATLAAGRGGYPNRRIVALFQPHLYSRTRDFARQFAEALAAADVPIVAPIYAARESPVDGVSARLIADAAPGIEFIDRSNAGIFDEVRRRLRPNDLFIVMGAGDVHEIAEMLVRDEP